MLGRVDRVDIISSSWLMSLPLLVFVIRGIVAVAIPREAFFPLSIIDLRADDIQNNSITENSHTAGKSNVANISLELPMESRTED